ncbi:isocitrate lyase/phosphoenolpyruvate mutase family protein [Pseudoxanthomonas sp. UTMC 1351]|uniref:isocitrate lyase/phosphoenolpyruvate mutase family protein n=1 Tax=Pseudoxanthomonas sp. UTMC 1351 TaxID=2695853 RepID=UPI0034CEDFD0
MTTYAAHTQRFRQLHADGLLLLANAWDAGSARLIESLGASAIATTSAGVAWAHGYADGDQLPVPHLLAAVAEIRLVIDVPLSVDVEGGYSDQPDLVADAVVQLVQEGVSGINLEDGGSDPELLCAKIASIKRVCAQQGLDVFINARTDVYLRQLAPAGERVEATLHRAALYRTAGADGLFVPGVTDAEEIHELSKQAQLPLNVMLRPALPSPQELAKLGVRRLSAGSNLAESVYGHLQQRAKEFLQNGVATPSQGPSYPELNALFVGR